MDEDDEQPTRIEALAPELVPDLAPERAVAAAGAVPLGPGTEIHGYVIDGELGKGGMGFVYSAVHPLIGKRAAIKILKPEVSKSPIILERFLQEARAVNQIQHPNIVDIFAFGTLPDGRAYHVMDLLAGETLRKRLRRGALHPSEAAAILDQTAAALIAAHDKGFVHRDLKPDNIFLVPHEDRWPEVKLLDFGLAKLMPEGGVAAFTTKVGVMIGTPEYMSPEQARGVGVDYRTDIYALGVLAFELLAGQRPFPSLGEPFATLQAHVEAAPPSLGARVAGLPDELVQLVDAMLAKDAAARPSLAAIRAVLKRLRATHLPTRTAAGIEIASFERARPPSAPPALELRTSHVGAEPMVSSGAGVRFSQMQTPPQPAPIVRAPDPSAGNPRHGAQPPLGRAPSQPPYGSYPGIPARSTHGGGTNPPAPPPTGAPGPASAAPPANAAAASSVAASGASVAAAHPASGLAHAHAPPLGGTKLGVPPPPRPSAGSLQPPAAAPARRHPIWIALAMIAALAAGVGLALVLA